MKRSSSNHGAPATERALATADAGGGLFRESLRSFPDLGYVHGRTAVVDAGSNSVRLVVYEGDCRSPAVLCNEKILCGLGARLEETGALDPKGKEHALRAFRRFAALASRLEVTALAGVATAAIREASDGPAFRDEVEAETGIRLQIASGPEEARLGALGVLFGNPSASGVVVDLGGASMEFCRLRDGAPDQGVTTPLGPQRLRHFGDDTQGMDGLIAETLKDVAGAFRLDDEPLYLVGGSWRALARGHMERVNYPLRVLHEYRLPAETAREHAKWLAAADAEAQQVMSSVSSSRLATLPLAGRLLNQVVKILKPSEVIVSGFGLREGICFEHMPPALRREDPLLSGCKTQERLNGRDPGFGAELGNWLVAFLGGRAAMAPRLVRAAAYLADVCWRAHPDYRMSNCWETVTRVTVTDAGHKGRAMMGLALATRYRRGRKTLGDLPAVELLSETEHAQAVEVGLAMRLGCILAAASTGVLPGCPLRLTADGLVLTLAPRRGDLIGMEVEKRIARLARELGCDWRIDIS